MPRLKPSPKPSGHTILVVDDDQSLLYTLESLLLMYGHRVLLASSGAQALSIALEHRPHLILLDYFMPEMNGEQVVQEVRQFDPNVQIVLQTGYASERPALEMLERLDIQGYHDKSEGPDKLMVWVNAALKSYRQTYALQMSRDGLRHVLQITPDLHRLQPLDDLLHGVLNQLHGLIGLSGAVVQAEPGAIVSALPYEGYELRVCSGSYTGKGWGDLEPQVRQAVITAISSRQSYREGPLVLPLAVGSKNLGAVLFDGTLSAETDLSLLEVFAAQAAVAIENARLFEMATVDILTGLASRSHWTNQLNYWLHVYSRHGGELGLLMMDLDRFKAVNDCYGHPVGDRVLAEVSRTVRHNLRNTDIVGRYGGEELAVLLPNTSATQSLQLAEALRAIVDSLRLPVEGGEVHPTVSVGVSHLKLQPSLRNELILEALHAELICKADAALYLAKHRGRNQVQMGKAIGIPT